MNEGILFTSHMDSLKYFYYDTLFLDLIYVREPYSFTTEDMSRLEGDGIFIRCKHGKDTNSIATDSTAIEILRKHGIRAFAKEIAFGMVTSTFTTLTTLTSTVRHVCSLVARRSAKLAASLVSSAFYW